MSEMGFKVGQSKVVWGIDCESEGALGHLLMLVEASQAAWRLKAGLVRDQQSLKINLFNS